MTPDEIVTALAAPQTVTDAVLWAAVGEADAVAPRVYAVAEKLCRGAYLMPEEAGLLFHGLNVLAAARHRDLYPQVLALARLGEVELDNLFPLHASTSLARLLLSVWDGDADALLRMLEYADLSNEARWALFEVLARLTFDGRIAREKTTAFLERFESEGLADEHDNAWWGWEEAVVKLGLSQLEPALRRVWEKPVYEHHTSEDHADSLDVIRQAAAAPTDPAPFDEADVRVIDDPVEAAAWLNERAEAQSRSAAGDDGGQPMDAHDAASAIRLTDDEMNWLIGFLGSRQAPPSTVSIEMLDGFFTALVIGPTIVPPSRYLPTIWGTDASPAWDSKEQAERVLQLLTRHWNAIAARRTADVAHHPFILPYHPEGQGSEWGEGFLVGLDLTGEDWQPMLDDRRASDLVMAIAALANDADAEPLTSKARDKLIERLPSLLQTIAAYWRDPERRLPRLEPRRSAKIGRNDPCPCGSGKKFKKCCGGSAPPLH